MTKHLKSSGLFDESNTIDSVTMKLSIAAAILNALHEQHCYTEEPPTLPQSDIANLIYASMRLVRATHDEVGKMPVEAGIRRAA